MMRRNGENGGKELEAASVNLVSAAIFARAKAVEAMAALRVQNKADTPEMMAARCLDSDMQRIMHGSFEV